MTRAKTVTKLTLDRWAQIIGISPVHFSGALADGSWMYSNVCDDIWPQHSWQKPEVASREHIADLIATATMDIENVLGYFLTPTYVHGEQSVYYANNYRRIWTPTNKTKWRKLQSFGQYTKVQVELDLEATLTDDNSDGCYETATITLDYTGDWKELRFYTADKSADDSYRLYPKQISTVDSDTIQVTFDAWVLINPELWEKPPALFEALDATLDATYYVYIDVYQYKLDPTLPQARFVWSQGDPKIRSTCNCNGNGCATCGVTTQAACVSILDSDRGIFSPIPANYDADSGTYIQTNFSVASTPSYIEYWYTSGDMSQEYVLGKSYDPLSLYWAESVAHMSAARLRFPVCSCSGSKAAIDDLMRDLVAVDKNRSIYVSILSPDMLTNPFGTRAGEVYAWNRIYRLNPDSSLGGGVI